jgi:hypothetical protein
MDATHWYERVAMDRFYRKLRDLSDHMRTFTIELRVDDSDPAKVELVTQAARVSAKHLLTTALLLQDNGRKPLIALTSGDLFETDKEISLADDLD